MLAHRRLGVALLTLVVSGLVAACGGGTSGSDGDTTAEPPRSAPAQEQAGEERSSRGPEACDDVPVPGHEATDVRARGATCARAEELVAAAVGKGRARYQAAGFTCEPSDAAGGDTDYVCTRDAARVTFRYGAA